MNIHIHIYIYIYIYNDTEQSIKHIYIYIYIICICITSCSSCYVLVGTKILWIHHEVDTDKYKKIKYMLGFEVKVFHYQNTFLSSHF